MSTSPILRIEHLTKVYGRGEAAVTALDDVSFTVERGSFVSIVGPSGSGKSTLLHIIGGVDIPTSGRVVVDDTDLSTLPEAKLAIFRRRQIGLVYQFYNLIPVLTVEENLTLPLLLDGRKIDGGQLVQLAARLGLADKMQALPGQLSGGQQQRVSVGRALLTRRPSCWPTNRPATSIPKPAPRLSPCSKPFTPATTRRCCSSPMTAAWPCRPTACSRLRTAGLRKTR